MPDTSRPIPVKKLRGAVTRAMYGKGSKSEREAIFIETPRGRFILRRKGGSAFADSELEGYAGHNVECDGFLVGTTLLAEHIALVK